MAAAPRATAEIWGEPPTLAKDDVAAPIWPPEKRIALWPDKPPVMPTSEPTPSLTMNGPRGARELWVSGIARPEINVFRAPRPAGSALLVFPGGSYTFLSAQNGGIDVARRYTPFSTSVFVLTCRLPGEGWRNRDRVPLQDAQRALWLTGVATDIRTWEVLEPAEFLSEGRRCRPTALQFQPLAREHFNCAGLRLSLGLLMRVRVDTVGSIKGEGSIPFRPTPETPRERTRPTSHHRPLGPGYRLPTRRQTLHPRRQRHLVPHGVGRQRASVHSISESLDR
jgi:hypothetical protein